MSFLTDLVEGHDSNLGNDITGMFRPNEIGQTLEGAGLVAGGLLTGGALLGGAGGLFGAGAGAGAAADAGAGVDIGGMFSSIFGNTAGASTDAAITAADPLSLVAPTDAASTFGSTPAGGAIQSALGYGGGASPAGFASTDAELFGGATGVPSAGAPAGGFAPTDAELSGGITGTGDAAPAAGATPAASPAGGGGFWNTLTNPSQWTLGGLGKAAGVAAAGTGLGMDLLNRNQMDPNQAVLAQQAAQLGQSGQVLESYLKTGKLPPALQTQLDQAVAAEKARIVSGYAAKGMPTDPNQNSALAQDLNNVQTNAIAAMANVQVEMMNTGLKETGLSSQLYQMLTQLDLQQNKDLMSAISSFAAALGGGMGGGQNVKLSLG
jgi:hypothetical protein